MAIDPRGANREWWIHQIFTWMAFLALLVVTLILFTIGARFLRPQAMFVSFTGLLILQVVVWIFSRHIVVLLTQCEQASGKDLERLMQLLTDFLPRSGLKHTPTLYVSAMDKPNAFAFGSGILGDHSLAVTKELLKLLNDDELQAVLAHECGHLRAHDTTLMMLVSILLTYCGQIIKRLKHIGRAALVPMLLLRVAIYLPQIVTKGIAQLREYGADCFAAIMIGSGRPLIAALMKLEGWQSCHQNDDARYPIRGPLDDLMLSHPNMGMRRWMLEKLESLSPKEKERC